MASCAAVGCLNNQGKIEENKEKGISFFKFPKDAKVLKEWLIKMKRNDHGMPYKPTKYSVMCSEHFVEEDFEYQPFTSKLKYEC